MISLEAISQPLGVKLDRRHFVPVVYVSEHCDLPDPRRTEVDALIDATGPLVYSILALSSTVAYPC